MPRQFAGWFGTAALQLIALVLAHELVFLARYNSRYGEALVHAGHGDTWTAAVTSIVVLAGVLALAGAARLAYLGVLVRRRELATPARGSLDLRALLRAWLRVGPRVAAIAVVLLSIQENLERASIGQAIPGPGVLLSPEYPDGLLITTVTSLAVGLVAALFDWRRRALLARLRAARAATPRAARTPVRRTGVLDRLPARSILGRMSALRAPPLVGLT